MNRKPNDDAVVMALTSKSIETILREGGVGNWRANESKVRRCRWVVAARNRHSNWSQGDEAHGTAFLIGRVVGVQPSPKPQEPDRLVIVFDRYAKLDIPNAWPGNHRNPVAYTTLSDLKVDPLALDWTDYTSPMPAELAKPQGRGQIIEQARLMIANALGVDASTVKVSIQV